MPECLCQKSLMGVPDVSTKFHGRKLGEWSMRRQRKLAQAIATIMSSYSAIHVAAIRGAEAVREGLQHLGTAT